MLAPLDAQHAIMSLSKLDCDLRVYDDYFNPGLPLVDSATIEYYIDALNPYKGCRASYEGFMKDMETFGDSKRMIEYMGDIMNSMMMFLTNHPSMIKFKLDEFRSNRERFLRTTPWKNKEKLYRPDNHFKQFIQVKLKEPYLNMILNRCPTRSVFSGAQSWEEFVDIFDEKKCYTLRHSKQAQSIFFNLVLGTGALTQLMSEQEIKQIATERKWNPDDVVIVGGDEVVVKYDFDVEKELRNTLKADLYDIKIFRLVRIGSSGMYVKEHLDVLCSKVVSKELKCVPAKNIMEVIKFIEKREVEPKDRRFRDDSGRIAVYEENMKFE